MVDHRLKQYRDLVKMTPKTSDLMSETIDGQTYQYKTVPQCKVCKAGDAVRKVVDSLLLAPKNYREVLEHVRPLEEELGIPVKDRISYDSIRNHQKNHLPFDKQIVRQIVEKRAAEKNRKILEDSGRLLTEEAFLEVLVSKGWNDIVEGRQVPNVAQTIYAMEQLSKLEKANQESYRPEVLLHQLNTIIQAMREVLPPDMRDKVLDRISELQDSPEPATIIDGEIAALNSPEDEYIDDDLEEI